MGLCETFGYPGEPGAIAASQTPRLLAVFAGLGLPPPDPSAHPFRQG